MEKAGIGFMVTGAWQGLEERVAAEFAKSGIERDRITFPHSARMQYYGQLNDIEIVSPHMEMEEGEHLDALIDAFEEAYSKVYARSARSPELGYLITQAIVHGSVEVEKPALPRARRVSGEPPVTSTRTVRWRRRRRRDLDLRLDDVAGRPRDPRPGDRRALANHLRDPAGAGGAARRPRHLPPDERSGGG